MLTCKKCSGILDVIRVEQPPEHLTKQERLLYDRLCDVKCLSCGMVYYSQPYDFMKPINPVRNIE
ncbi:hypothetical protein QFZ77_007632 [Paenibacillus sp. V4I3]|nr:hypothetical protein [Paenibacillus sp. V4I3]